MVDKKESRKEIEGSKKVRIGYIKLWIKGKLWVREKVEDGLGERQGKDE